jgi:hypothetical protein
VLRRPSSAFREMKRERKMFVNALDDIIVARITRRKSDKMKREI